MHLIFLPAMTFESYHLFLQERRYQSATMDTNLREFYKTRTESFTEDQKKVMDMTRHAWRGYRKFAGWRDYVNVQSSKPGSVYGHDMALTTVDSLDTLFIMGLHDEFDAASTWVKANLSEVMFKEGTVSFFEVTIRSLGGLMSAYYLSGEKHFLSIADSLGRALQMGFTCGNFVPCRAVDLENRVSYDEPLLSEAGTFQLEFAYLAHVTEDDSFMIPVNHVNSIAVAGMQTKLVGYSYPSNFTYISKIRAMEHLTCFVPGMLALGYYHGMPSGVGKEITETCVQNFYVEESAVLIALGS